MPTIVVDVKVLTVDGLRVISARSGDLIIQSEVLAEEVESVAELAAWLISQRGRGEVVDEGLQKRLTITYHVSTSLTPDPETGWEYDVVTVDSVTTESLPDDRGREHFRAMAGWSTWRAVEARDWIDANVVDLTHAKGVLMDLAEAVIYLRNISVD